MRCSADLRAEPKRPSASSATQIWEGRSRAIAAPARRGRFCPAGNGKRRALPVREHARLSDSGLSRKHKLRVCKAIPPKAARGPLSPLHGPAALATLLAASGGRAERTGGRLVLTSTGGGGGRTERTGAVDKRVQIEQAALVDDEPAHSAPAPHRASASVRIPTDRGRRAIRARAAERRRGRRDQTGLRSAAGTPHGRRAAARILRGATNSYAQPRDVWAASGPGGMRFGPPARLRTQEGCIAYFAEVYRIPYLI